jgi:hypothetical protein
VDDAQVDGSESERRCDAMGYASRSGRAVTNPEAPRAFGVCDDCGIWYNLFRLTYKREWQGTQLANLRFRVCDTCQDRPNPQLRARLMPQDPVPVHDPRPQNFVASRFAPSPVSGNPILTEQWQPGPSRKGYPILTEQAPQAPITIE